MDVPIHEIVEETGDAIDFSPLESFSVGIDAQIVDVAVPQVQEDLVEFVKLVSPQRLQQRTMEQIMDVPVP